MKHLNHRLLLVVGSISLFLTLNQPTQAAPSYISPQCQALLKGADPSQFPLEVVDMCLLTGFNQEFQAYENEYDSFTSRSNKIVSQNIPEGAICSLNKPDCPPGSVTYANGKTETIQGQCSATQQHPMGLCTYTKKVTLKHKIKGLDFAKPPLTDPDTTNTQNPNILLNKQLFKLLPLPDYLQQVLNLLFKKLARSSEEVKLYLDAIDPETEFNCYLDNQTYTLKQVKNAIPPQIKNLFEQQKWDQLYQLYQQALDQKKSWAQLIACTPLAPTSSPLHPQTHSPGFTYMTIKSSLGTLKTQHDQYPTDVQHSLPFGTFVLLLSQLSTQEQKLFFQKLQETSPLALAFRPSANKTSKKNFLAHHQPINNTYTLIDYANTVINNPNLKGNNISLPKHIPETNIEKAGAIETTGFPANLGELILQVLAAAGIHIEKHFLTIPSLNQQVVDTLFKTQLQLELSSADQNILDSEKDHPIALKGSTYAGGLEYAHLYQSRNFSFIMPFSFPEYCPYQTHINEYIGGLCQPNLNSGTSNPFLSE